MGYHFDGMTNVVTQQQLLETAAERYRQNTGENPIFEQRYEQLKALNPPTLETISEITTWPFFATCQCDQCYRIVDKVVVLDVTSGEYVTWVCQDCLTEALSELVGSDFMVSKSTSNKLDSLTNLPRGETTNL